MRNQRWLEFGTMLLIAGVGSIPSAAKSLRLVRRRTICDQSELPSGHFGDANLHSVACLGLQRPGPLHRYPTNASPGTYKTAAASLVEKHERQKKRKAGIAFTLRGRLAAALDARGAVMGAVGGVGFAVVAWRLFADHGAAVTLTLALLSWISLSSLLWYTRKHHPWARPTTRTSAPTQQ